MVTYASEKLVADSRVKKFDYTLSPERCTLNFYGPGIDEPICMINISGGNETIYFYHFDGLESVTALSNSSGTIIERYSYDVFGEPNRTSSIGNPYLFTGRQYDDETGNYYYRARYYKPTIGRFLQTDKVGYADGLNMYSYCGNNPLNWTDPYGLCKDGWLDGFLDWLSGTSIGPLIGFGPEGYSAYQAWSDFSVGYSMAGQGVVNVFTGGMFNRNYGIFYNTFNNQWAALGYENSVNSPEFRSGERGGRIGETFLLGAAGAWAWQAVGGPTMNVSVGELYGQTHIAYGTGSTTLEALGTAGQIQVYSGATFTGSVATIEGIPILSSGAIAATEGMAATNCLTAAGYAYTVSGGAAVGVGIGAVSSTPIWVPSLVEP